MVPDLSTGPTSLIGLLTAQAIRDIGTKEYTPQQIASAVAMWMGVYGMILGFLKLGFILDFISVPILTGFISAAAITIALGQVASLLGEQNVSSGSTAQTIHDIFKNLPSCNGIAAAVGLTGIILLTFLQYAGKWWGKKSKIVWFLCITRAFIALLLFTGIGYAVNHNKSSSKQYLFDVSQVPSGGIVKPKMADSKLITEAASSAIAAFIASAVEHTAIARAFGRRNNYVTDQSQELAYYGVTNFINSFFSTMGVGGAMSRTAVNSQCNVRSPLSGFLTAGVVLISIYKLTGALYWIPKATLAAIIITAVWPLFGSPVTYYKFWRVSFHDFVAAMIAFWVSLFKTTEIGIGSAVAFNIAYCLLRQVFTRATTYGSDTPSDLAASLDAARAIPEDLPADVRVFRFNESVFFPNAYRVLRNVFDTVQTYHAPRPSTAHGEEADRNWSVVGEKRVAALRKKAGINPANLPQIRVVIFDFSKVNHTDVTGITSMRSFVDELEKYAGEDVEVRFVAVANHIKVRFERAGWPIMDAESWTDAASHDTVRLFRSVSAAATAPSRQDIYEVVVKGEEKI